MKRSTAIYTFFSNSAVCYGRLSYTKLQKTKTNIRYLKFNTFNSMSCYWAWNSKTVKLLCHPPPLCSMKRSTAIYSFFSNSAGCYGRLFYTKQQKKMTFQRPSQSLELIIQEWWAFQNDTIWHHDSPCTFELFKEYHSRE